MNKGQLYVLSGPSGCGKGTIVGELLARRSDLHLSVSMTTRAPRDGEEDGVAYYFVTRERFDQVVEENGVLECAHCGNGDSYGTPRAPIEQWLGQGEDVLLEIDIQGFRQVRKACPEAVGIFILPPSWNELERRLYKRGSESEEKIRQRLETGKYEVEHAAEYDYIIINDELEQAVEQVRSVMTAQRLRADCMRNKIEEVLNHA